jgi:hypothetical protein
MRDLVVARFRRPMALLPLGCAVAIALSPQLASAAPGGAFSSFAGEWTGVGRLFGADGKTAPLRCRETNVVSDDNISLTQTLVCANERYRGEFHVTLFTDGHIVRGTFQDVARGAGGNVYGQVARGAIVATITAPGVRALLSAKTSANRQDVTVEPEGGQLRRVTVTMRR